jgi:hypothetical protein
MNVGIVDGAAAFSFLRGDGSGSTLDRASGTEDFAVGQLVEVAVIDRSGVGRYGVRINGQLHSADSTSALQPGTSVIAVVTSVGERLELRAMSLLEDPALAQTLSTLAARYRAELSAAAQGQLVLAASASDSALAALRAGLYLKKLEQDVTPAALAALVAAQRLPASPDSAARDRTDPVVPNLNSTAGADTHSLAQLLERVMAPPDAAGAAAGGSLGFSDSQTGGRQAKRDPRQAAEGVDPADSRCARAQQLLNLSDGGALQYHYATLPLLVAGKLVELDMALFQQRSATPSAGAPRRLVMSLGTNNLGAVRIVAQSLRTNLNVSLTSNSERGVAILSAAVSPMRERLAALGWQVDGVRFELATEVAPAGRDIIDHVLTSGSLDRAV